MLGEIDPEEYMEYMYDLEPDELDRDDLEPKEFDQPEKEPNTEPKEFDEYEQEPKEPLDDFKPGEICAYRREYLGKNWQHKEYYY